MAFALALAALLPGCVAAIPLGAAALIGRDQIAGDGDQPATAPVAQPVPVAAPVAAPPPAPVAAPAPVPTAVPAGSQYLYGSGEAAAQSVQAYRALTDWLAARAADRRAGRALSSVVLAEGAALDGPRFAACGAKPLAVVLDVDETSILNLGYGADDARRGLPYDQARWERWETTGGASIAAVPGASAAIAAARAADIAVVYNSNRSAKNALYTEVTLDIAGIGPAKHGETLFLRDDETGGGKDSRRAKIAARYCVVAMVGDQLGDFSDGFNAPGTAPAGRRMAAIAPALTGLWGAGWFILPNPVYGTGLAGGLDDVFPTDRRWTDPAEEKAP